MLTGIALALWGSPVALSAPDESSGLFSDADRSRVEADLRALTGHDAIETSTGSEFVRSRSIFHPQVDVAALWLEEQLAGISGVSVRTSIFEAEGQTGLVNLIGELPGRSDLPAVVLCAHYDSTASLDPEWLDPGTQDAPGADDDASGVVAVLEAARVLASAPGFERPIQFILFSAEEVGLVGSFHQVDAMLADGEGVEVVIALDPVGYDPGNADYLWFSYDDRWAESAAHIETFGMDVAAEALQVIGVDAALIGGDSRSDHYPYWLEGFEAVHFGSFPQPPTYHTMDDDLHVVDLDFVRDVSGFAAAYAGYRAGPLEVEEPGQPGACGCSAPLPTGWWFVLAAGAAMGRREVSR